MYNASEKQCNAKLCSVGQWRPDTMSSFSINSFGPQSTILLLLFFLSSLDFWLIRWVSALNEGLNEWSSQCVSPRDASISTSWTAGVRMRRIAEKIENRSSGLLLVHVCITITPKIGHAKNWGWNTNTMIIIFLSNGKKTDQSKYYVFGITLNNGIKGANYGQF